jgi:hypothetical protein
MQFQIFLFRMASWKKYNCYEGRGNLYLNPYSLSRGWRELHNEELHNLYSSPGIIRMIKSRRMRWAGHVVRMGEKSNAYRILVGKPERNRPLGRP